MTLVANDCQTEPDLASRTVKMRPVSSRTVDSSVNSDAVKRNLADGYPLAEETAGGYKGV